MILPWTNIKDEDCIDIVKSFLPDCKTIIEAGTCAADDTIKFKSAWPDCEVHTFEPNPDLFEIAKKNIVASGKSGIHQYNYALSDHVGVSSYYASEFQGTSSLFKNNMRNIVYPQTVIKSIGVNSGSEIPIYSEREITINCVTIDSMNLSPDFIWLDVEGAELLALSGATKTMEKAKCIYLELNHQEFREGMAQFDEVMKFMNNHGYDLRAIWKAHDNWQSNGIFWNGNLK